MGHETGVFDIMGDAVADAEPSPYASGIGAPGDAEDVRLCEIPSLSLVPYALELQKPRSGAFKA